MGSYFEIMERRRERDELRSRVVYAGQSTSGVGSEFLGGGDGAAGPAGESENARQDATEQTPLLRES